MSWKLLCSKLPRKGHRSRHYHRHEYPEGDCRRRRCLYGQFDSLDNLEPFASGRWQDNDDERTAGLAGVGSYCCCCCWRSLYRCDHMLLLLFMGISILCGERTSVASVCVCVWAVYVRVRGFVYLSFQHSRSHCLCMSSWWSNQLSLIHLGSEWGYSMATLDLVLEDEPELCCGVGWKPIQ